MQPIRYHTPMSIFQAILLAVIEGITEFLPVSSTGHLILASQLLGITQNEFVKSFELFIQLGAIAAVAILYMQRLFVDKQTLGNVIAAFFPTALIGFIAYPLIKSLLLGNAMIVVVALTLGGIVLIVLESYVLKQSKTTPLNLKRAVAIGLIQTLSFVPGVSRAAATIVGGMLVGLPRTRAVEFSFLLAIPTMFAATGLDMMKSGFAFSPDQWTLLIVGFMGAFITASATVKLFVQFVSKHTFVPFGIYRIVAAAAFAILTFP